MATLVWDKIEDRIYETGVSKCVLYKYDGYGVAWSGLTSVEEEVDNEVESVHFDGVKFNDIVTIGDFSGVIKAFTYPEEFLFYEGTIEDQTGFYLLNQEQTQFSLSYQTKISDVVNGSDAGYKIHLLYNLTALPSQRSHQTLSLDVEPIEFEWTITAIPEELDNFRPTAHIVFDSRRLDPYLLKDLEEILYGSENNDPYMPTLKGLATFLRKWDRLIITDLGNGMWEAYSIFEDVITMLDPTTFQIVSDTATYLDADTYTIESSEKNEEDIWLP